MRNQRLIAWIQAGLISGNESFGKFKSKSAEFRQGDLTADEYYKCCRSLIGSGMFDDVIVELIALLPDIAKQQELLAIHRAATFNVKKMTANPWVGSEGLLACPQCGQVLVVGDLGDHRSMHNFDSDFPAVGSGGNRKGEGKFGGAESGYEQIGVR
jgi:hypothetical protein